VWGYIGTVEDGYTKTYTSFPVIEKSKPLDYVFTPTEQITLQGVLDKIENMTMTMEFTNVTEVGQ
jgi:hypothetical protein